MAPGQSTSLAPLPIQLITPGFPGIWEEKKPHNGWKRPKKTRSCPKIKKGSQKATVYIYIGPSNNVYLPVS